MSHSPFWFDDFYRNPNASGETERSKKNAKLEIQIERVRKSNSECECEEREIRDLTVAIFPATVMSFFEGSLYGLEVGGSCSSGDLNQDKDDSNTESGNASILNSVSLSLSLSLYVCFALWYGFSMGSTQPCSIKFLFF